MKKSDIVNKNLDLNAEFMRYTFEHPEILDQIPEGARIVFLPDDDPELCEANLKVDKEVKAQDPKRPTVYVRMKMPKPQVPRIETKLA